MSTLKILTLNVWALRVGPLHLAKTIRSRLRCIPHYVAEQNADIIFLQEVWQAEDQNFLQRKFADLGYHYSFAATRSTHFYASNGPRIKRNLLGNGLLIISRFPIENAENVLLFSKPTFLQEYLSHKGALHAVAMIPHIGPIDLYNVHLGAIYFHPTKHLLGRRQRRRAELQLKEFVQFVQDTKSASTQIIAGDFNLHESPQNPQVLLEEIEVVDTYRAIYPCPINDPGHTYHSQNPYTLGMKSLGERRLDYIFLSKMSEQLAIVDSQVLEGNEKFVPSDHQAVMTVLKAC